MEKAIGRIYVGMILFIMIVLTFCLICAHHSKPTEKVESNISNIMPKKELKRPMKNERSNRQDLLCENSNRMYTYDNLIQDLQTICHQYPNYVQERKLCTTCDGRDVIDLVISGDKATKNIFINGSTHANEYISSQLIMKQLISFLDGLKDNEQYNGVSLKDLLNDVAIHVVPMVNPDGVTLCQSGLSGIRSQSISERIKNIAKMDGENISEDYFHMWKANAEGVDINRNYPSNWTTYNECSHPSNRFYKGPTVASTAEAKAIMDLTFKEKFVRAISYHTQGQIIYCVKNNNFAKLMAYVTGYGIEVLGSKVEPAYSDWTDRDLSMKSLTLELGSGNNPLPQSQLEQMWYENQDVWTATLFDLKKNGV